MVTDSLASIEASPLRVPQYQRMSTERQEYSPVNQAAAIAVYAAEHGMTLVRTYCDE